MSKLTNDLMYIGETAHHGPEDLFIAQMVEKLFPHIGFNVNAEHMAPIRHNILKRRAEGDMRKKLFDHLQKLSFKFYDNNKTGSLMSKLTNDNTSQHTEAPS
jgi:ABC-type multidrug transport system fused ATPase/permease subunit